MQRVLAAIQIYSLKVLRITFDFGKAQTHATVRIRAAESAPHRPRPCRGCRPAPQVTGHKSLPTAAV